ncbi:Rne/Rng family ribonuclease [Nocardioides limicola]|uniref:Rne/Rng family ribonuclease n=1 Tax=Nocardioides limicola TaxID=2803368 RepID=UPI00193BA100|nr:Rne/Rng family ribonuclease [Nocardioides sp. DJM-14]
MLDDVTDESAATEQNNPDETAETAPPAESAEAPPAETAETAPPKKKKRQPAKTKEGSAVKTPVDEAPVEEAPPAESGDALVAEPEDEAPAPKSVPGTMLLFQAPDASQLPPRPKRTAPVVDELDDSDDSDDEDADDEADDEVADQTPDSDDEDDTSAEDDDESTGGQPRRRRRRGGRRRRKPGTEGEDGDESEDDTAADDEQGSEDDSTDSEDDESGDESGGSSSTRRRRRRRRAGDGGGSGGGGGADDPQNTVTRVRQARSAEDEITSVSGSTRLEAKKQRRREGREAGRRRAPIVSEAEFLARREAVERVMVIRQAKDLIQIGVLEDKVLVEHYVARESQTSLIGNVYLGRVQNVLPSMEAAFIDIGKGRNAVLYAGEVNWSALGHTEGQPRKIESVLTSGQSVLVQVTKDPVGHKGARLTSQISLAGRFLVYVPDGTTSGISRKLPDTERGRLKALLKEIVPETAGVIVRTAAEGASEEELSQDVARLKARWEDIDAKATSGGGPKLLYGEPDLTLKVVRDLFTEDFAKLVIEGDDVWDTVQTYVAQVAPDLEARLERYTRNDNDPDSFAAYRIDEQIAKGLDRKVWLPSGGSLVIDRTEAMTVVDVNTGKFTGSGGNLEETVTKNNLEAAEEIVRQLRLRDIGGIIVVDFIDMVLESNRDLVLRRLVECLGRDRTRHQVAEVTSLGLVQMTRKRIGTGLLEAFSENCSHCEGRGVIISDMPVDSKRGDGDSNRRNRRTKGGKGGGSQQPAKPKAVPSPKDVAAVARPENADRPPADEADAPSSETQAVETQAPDTQSPAAEPTEAPGTEAPAPEAPGTEAPAPEKRAVAEKPAKAAEPTTPVERPTVVTSTRRRSARRPAGSPAGDASVGTVVIETPTQPVAPPPATEAPKVTVRTRTRGRVATPAPAADDQK